MNNQNQIQEDRLLSALDNIKPDVDEFINRRINHINFARTIFFLCVKARNEDYVLAKDLSLFLRLSMQRSLNILNELATAGILNKKNPVSNMAEFWFILDNEETPLVMKFFDKCKKTLGVEFKISLESKEEKKPHKRLRRDLI
jgi:hypothetical protein